MSVPYATNYKATYENFIARCPLCDNENVFNRASDLERLDYISFQRVTCFNCGEGFNINGDLAARKYEYLIYDGSELIRQKRFMYCILNATQAFEAFFGRYLKVILVDRPLKLEIISSIEEANELLELLYAAIGRFAFVRLRNAFIRSILEARDFNTTGDIRNEITALANDRNRSNTPSDAEIASLQNTELAQMLNDLKNFAIHELRNNVVHRHAYRPTLEEAEECLRETRRLIFRMRAILGFEDDATPSLSPT